MQATQSHHIFLPSWLASLPFALVLTFALLSLMVKLVFIELAEPIDEPSPIFPSIVYKEKQIETRIDGNTLEPPIIEPVPPVPKMSNNDRDDHKITIPPISTKPTATGNEFAIGFTGMPIAQYLVTAKYPSTALRNGIEGYVDVKFDITKMGSTENVHVVAANPQGIFDKSAVQAVLRWRYQPQMYEGEAKPFKGMIKRIRFTLGEG